MITADQVKPTTPSGNVFIDSLTYADAFGPGMQITYVLQGAVGDGVFGGATWAANDARMAFKAALATWSAVANVTFVESPGPYNGDGDTAAYDWIESFAQLDEDVGGQHDLPFPDTMIGQYNGEGGLFSAVSLAPGSVGFAVFVHEIGHGLGLLHPHNDGDEPAGDPAFPAVVDANDYGANSLNQGVYSVMTYNSGYAEVGYSVSLEYGWESAPMAFDIAAIQRIYGANLTTNFGDSTFVLSGANAIGAQWRCIWDAGGLDAISAGETQASAIIDLRAATLNNEPGGGGFVSRVAGALGGVTIANGVVIENAIGGAGDDRLHGNAAANRLDGGKGFDTVDYSGVAANLDIDLKRGVAIGDGVDTLISIENAIGGSGDDRLIAFDGLSTRIGQIDVVKRGSQDISTQARALNLDDRFGDRSGDPTIGAGAGLQSVRVRAEAGDDSDFYGFTVGGDGPVLIDVDNSFDYDSVIKVYDAAGKLIASNDDPDDVDVIDFVLDPGSANSTDSLLRVEGLILGQRITVEVSDYNDAPLGSASSYDLIISQSARAAAGDRRMGSMLDGGAGNDTLISGRGDDTLIGGAGVDTAIFANSFASYAITGTRADDLVIASASDGRDHALSVERFQFSDGVYVWAAGKGLVAADKPIDNWRLFSSEGFIGTIGNTGGDGSVLGAGSIVGTNGGEAITVHDSPGVVKFDASFNRGGDSVTVAGKASEWRVSRDGSNVRLSDGDTDVILPVGRAGMAVIFDDGARTLVHDGDLKIGAQSVTSEPLAILSAADARAPLPETTDEASGRIFVSAGPGATLGGNYSVIGSNANETVTVLFGDIRISTAFNRGGDTLALASDPEDFTAVRSTASNIELNGADTHVVIPLGVTGMTLAFADDDQRTLLFDPDRQGAYIDNQLIGSSAVTLIA